MRCSASGGHLSKHTNHGDRALVDEDKQFTPDAEQDFATADIGDSGADKAPKDKKRSAGAWMGYGALVFVLVLVGAGVFLLHELRSQQESLGSGLDKGDKRVLDLQGNISRLEADIQTIRQEMVNVQTVTSTEKKDFERDLSNEDTALTGQIEALRTDLNGSIQRIQRQLNQTRGDIMVADAEYLLSVANQKLHLVGDVKAVIAMMEAADQRLLDSGDPAAFKVREALAEEINVLKGFTPPDIVGVSAKLLALEGKVKELPLFLPHSERAKEDHQPAVKPVDADSEPKNGGWTSNVVKDIKGLVTIRHTDRPVQAILVPEEVAGLRQVLLLKLEMSRASLLRGDDELYKTNMDSALAWLEENFDTEAALTRNLADELKSLQGLQLHVPFPDVSQSLTLLRNIEKLRLETEKGHPAKQEKASKVEKPIEAPAPLPQPPAPAPQQPAEQSDKLPVAEPLPEEEGARQ